MEVLFGLEMIKMFTHMNKVTNSNDKWQGHTDCHLAILSGEQVFLANFGLILSVMLILKSVDGVYPYKWCNSPDKWDTPNTSYSAP